MQPCQSPRSALRHVTVPASLWLVLACGTVASAQMSGTYTIDPTSTGSRNFKDFPNAAYQLFIQGVSGPVVIDVAPDNYSVGFNLGSVKGVSSTNTITFKSKTRHGARITGRLRILDYGPRFPVSWYVFDGFEFASVAAINAGGNCTDFEIKNCRFVDTQLFVSSSGGELQRWKIHHNKFVRSRWQFQEAQALEIHHNEFDLNNLTNSILAISMSNRTTTTSLRSRIYNNVIYGVTPGRFKAASGIATGPYVDIFHNTVFVHSVGDENKPRAGNRCIDTIGVFGRECRVGNNIMVNLAIDDCADYATEPFASVVDGNLYLSKHALNVVVNRQTLVNWQQSSGQDKNSIQADPQFVGPGRAATDLKLKPTSPAFAKAVNTPAYITDDFFGNPRPKNATIGAIEGTPPSTFTPFGAGCAGAGGKVPSIGMSGKLELGSRDFAVTLTNAKGGFGSAFFALGVTKTNLHFGGGCTLLVTPALLLGVAVSGPSGAGKGTSSIKLPIPNNSKLKGATAHCQWGVVDPAAKGIGIAFSNGATIRL